MQIWTVTESGQIGVFGNYSSAGPYSAGTLYKNIMTDENNKQVVEFKDSKGRVILKKSQLDPTITDDGSGSGYTGWLSTYYIYDNLDNLRAVIQPEGVKALVAYNWNFSNTTVLAEQCFRYEYDGRNRLIENQVPGVGPVYMVYDARDRLVMSQDANMRANNSQWHVILYDNWNRPDTTGLINNNASFGSILTAAASSTNYPGSISSVLTIVHYDSYNNLPSGLLSGLSNDGNWASQVLTASNNTWPYPQAIAQNSTTSTQGLVTWAQAAVINPDGSTGPMLTTTHIYDDEGRSIQTQSQNLNGGLDVTTTQYSWVGQPLVIVQKTANPKAVTNNLLVSVSKMTYDDLGRVVEVDKKQSSNSINNGVLTDYTTISQNQYDALGQLKNKSLGRQSNYTATYTNTPLETQAFDYNIRGWLLGVNRNYLKDGGSTNQSATLDAQGIGGELFSSSPTDPVTYLNTNYFGFELNYDKLPSIGDISSGKQINGNIAGMVWKSAHDQREREYGFTYDAVNRLTTASFGQLTNNSFTNAMVDYSVNNLSYDGNGNILSMQQKGLTPANSSTVIDNLTYSYQSGSNKLAQVTDNAVSTAGMGLGDFQDGTNTGDDYSYDSNGNLIQDNNKNILVNGILYNYLNLPSQITVNGKGSISYVYDASGMKLQKITTDNTLSPAKITTTTYIDNNVFQSTTATNNNTPINDTLQYFGMEEGRVRIATGGYFVYDYFLKDHLGNTRMVLTDDYNVSSPILEADSYYPFGLQQKEISAVASILNLQNKYLFNGKELNEDLNLNWYEYGARDNFDPQIGRFHSQDPIATIYPNYSPYQFAGNEVPNTLDLDGREPFYGYTNKYGQLVTMPAGDNLRRTQPPTSPEARAAFNRAMSPGPGAAASSAAIMKGMVLVGVAAIDIFLTKGWITRMVAASSLFGTAEHNKLPTGTPQGQAQEQREKENLSNAIVFGSGEILGLAKGSAITNPFHGLTSINKIGKVGENLTKAILEKRFPGAIILEQIGIKLDGADNMVADFVVMKDNNILGVFESKVNTSDLSNPQKLFFNDGDPGKFTGKNAKLGNINGLWVNPSEVENGVFYWDSNTATGSFEARDINKEMKQVYDNLLDR